MAAASRVVNDVANVSSETRDKVLSAVSHLQYSPNVHAAKLARTNGGIPRKLGVHPSTMTCAKIRPLFDPGDYVGEKLLNADRRRLLQG
jgi:Bacterial regulatory proteins, lacI family